MTGRHEVATNGSDLQGAHKVAALLLAVSRDVAVRILARFDSAELRRLARAAMTMGQLEPAVLRAIGEEFAGRLKSGPGVSIHEEAIAGLLVSATSSERAGEIIADVYHRPNPNVWQRLARMEPKPVAAYLAAEHGQTMAAILTLVPVEFATRLLEEAGPELRRQVLSRALTIAPLSEEARRLLGRVVEQDLLASADAGSSSRNIGRVAEICGGLDAEFVSGFLADAMAADPETGRSLRAGVFSFPEISGLDVRGVSLLVEACPMDTLVQALPGADEGLREALLSALPSRSRRMAEQELREKSARVQQKEVDAARARICTLAVQMIRNGVLERPSESQAA